jgi:hypothetical protein
MAQVGWSPAPAVWATATVERSVARVTQIMCDCAEVPCCEGANAWLTWFGAGIEGHFTPRRLSDVYGGAELGMVVRNAWRPAARAHIGVDLRLGPVALGPFAGVLLAADDSLFNYNSRFTFTGGLRLIVVVPVTKP